MRDLNRPRLKTKPRWQNYFLPLTLVWKQISSPSFPPSLLVPLEEKGASEEGQGLKARKRVSDESRKRGKGVREGEKGRLLLKAAMLLSRDHQATVLIFSFWFCLFLTFSSNRRSSLLTFCCSRVFNPLPGSFHLHHWQRLL